MTTWIWISSTVSWQLKGKKKDVILETTLGMRMLLYILGNSTVSPLLDFMANFSIFHRFLIIPKEVCLTLIATFQKFILSMFSHISQFHIFIFI